MEGRNTRRGDWELKKRKRLLAWVVVLQLFLMPLAVGAGERSTEASAGVQKVIPDLAVKGKPKASLSSKPDLGKGQGNLSSNLNEGKHSKLVEGVEHDYMDPGSYPLVDSGEPVDVLFDGRGYHYLYYDNMTEHTANDMKLQFAYFSDEAFAKDRYFWVEYYKDIDGKLFYDGYAYWNTYGYGEDGVYIYDLLKKEDLSGQEYIYMIAGTTPDLGSMEYTDYTMFKIKNPLYGGGSGEKDSYALISNESTNGNATEYTGAFQVNNQKYSFSKNLKNPDAYMMDYNVPFDPAKAKGALVSKNMKSVTAAYQVGDTKSFWVINMVTNKQYQITARLAYNGTRGLIWVHNNQITAAQAGQLGREFDGKIYTSVNSNFGRESDVDSDGKINILCFDIQDGFSGSGGYIGGYFFAGDLYDEPYSNKAEIFYMDTYPAMGIDSKDVSYVYGTLAHEFQHMVNFNQNALIEKKPPMEVWLNEALSMAAEQVYSGIGIKSRIDYYNISSSIMAGHSLLYWDYAGDQLSNYSLSYLFGQYVKVQAGRGNSIFKELINDPNSNYLAVENLAKKYINSGMSFGKLMTNFRAALLLKEASGLHGFKGDMFFDSVNVLEYNGPPGYMRGGGAVVVPFSSADGFEVPGGKGPSITYSLFEKESADVTPPARPVVNPVTTSDSKITGTAEQGSSVFAKIGSVEIGRASADSAGKFIIGIAKRAAGTKISVFAEDAAGNVSQPTDVFVNLAVPDGVKAASESYNSIKLTWAAVSGASGYDVYRATSSGGTYSKVGSITGTSFVNGSLSTGTTYFYKIRAYKSGGSTVYSSYSSVVSAKPVPGVPGSVKAASASYNSVKVTWSAVSGADGYEVYRAATSGGAYSLVGTVSGAGYTNGGLTTNKSYFYKVRAYRTVGKTKVYSGYSGVVSAKPVPGVPGAVKAASSSYNSVKISWGAVSGASGYQVYRATSSTGTYTLVGTLSGTSYTNGGLTTNKAYYYKVRAYRTVGSAKVYGSYSGVVSAKPIPSVPGNFVAARMSSSSIKVSWNVVSGASGYEVHRAVSTTGKYTLLKSTTSTNYTNTGLTKGKTYYYKVRAYRLVGKTKIYSGWTVIKSARP